MNSQVMRAYKQSIELVPLFQKATQVHPPLTFKDSLNKIPTYPFCTLGVISAEGKWGKKKGIAFVVEDNYLLTCASNCYSQKHGEYTNIKFTINSDRKHGDDTYIISKVFIPQQYKKFSIKKNSSYNYALLYIEGEPSLKDKYGSLKLVFKETYESAQRYFQCAIKDHEEIQMIAEHSLDSKKIIFSADGMPKFAWNITYAEVDGLIFQQENSSKPTLVKFDKEMDKQLAQWVKVQKGWMEMNDIPAEGLNLNSFKNMEAKPTGTIQIGKPKANDQKLSQIFKQFPFSSISSLYAYNSKAVKQFNFLKIDKFRNLKQLTLYDFHIGPNECNIILNIPLTNLRKLDLGENKPGHKGCEHLSKGNWPFLTCLSLSNCAIESTGLQLVTNTKFQNLLSLDISQNQFGQEISQVLEKADFPRVNSLNLAEGSLLGLALVFLKAPNWQQLSDLKLKTNRIGNHGCKMIKQSALALRNLDLDECQISDLGVKWLCKANTSRMISLSLTSNEIGDYGCLFLNKANFPNLTSLSFSKVDITARGIRYLVKAEWKLSIFSRMYCYYQSVQRIDNEYLRHSFQGKASGNILDIFDMFGLLGR